MELPGKDCWKRIRRGELMDEMARKCELYKVGEPPLPLEKCALGAISTSNGGISDGKP